MSNKRLSQENRIPKGRSRLRDNRSSMHKDSNTLHHNMSLVKKKGAVMKNSMNKSCSILKQLKNEFAGDIAKKPDILDKDGTTKTSLKNMREYLSHRHKPEFKKLRGHW